MYKENKGYQYEELARKYLSKKGYDIIIQNFTSRFGEIDIIAKNDDIIAFVEVKGRKNADFGMPKEFVTEFKQRKIIKTAKYFLLKNNIDDVQCRFDVIEIIAEDKIINHIEDAFGE